MSPSTVNVCKPKQQLVLLWTVVCAIVVSQYLVNSRLVACCVWIGHLVEFGVHAIDVVARGRPVALERFAVEVMHNALDALVIHHDIAVAHDCDSALGLQYTITHGIEFGHVEPMGRLSTGDEIAGAVGDLAGKFIDASHVKCNV